nr:cytochrome c3 family protein [uncultured Methanolobus sp.]
MKITRAFAIAILLTTILVNIANAVSTEDCKECHVDEYELWSSSIHYDNDGIISGKPGPEECIYCHFGSTPRLYSIMYGEVSAESTECEMCHRPPAEGFTTHTITPSEAVPPLNLSAESCEDCHTKPHHLNYEEWNEYNNSDYDTSTMKSHSKPTATETDTRSNSFESRVTCVMCHHPHSAELRMGSQELCANCHSSETMHETQEVQKVNYSEYYSGPQWEMYNGSIFTNGVHAVNLECIDCHMATITDKVGEEKLVTGHSFNFDPALLLNPNSGNICKKCHVTGHDKIPESGDCDDCHEVSLSNITLRRQEITANKLHELEILQANASSALFLSNSNENNKKINSDYDEAISYIEFIKADGSLGMHNAERTEEYLEKAEIMLRSITGEEGIDTNIKETDYPENEEQNENTVPEAGIEISFMIISLAAIALSMSKKKRGK